MELKNLLKTLGDQFVAVKDSVDGTYHFSGKASKCNISWMMRAEVIEISLPKREGSAAIISIAQEGVNDV